MSEQRIDFSDLEQAYEEAHLEEEYTFDDCNRFAKACEPMWDRFYRERFREGAVLRRVPGKAEMQRSGIDMQVQTADGNWVFFEEKNDRHEEKNFSIEVCANQKLNTPGWAEKDLKCDFLNYGFAFVGAIYMFRWSDFKNAWDAKKKGWWHQFKHVETLNPGYTSLNLLVPIGWFLGAVGHYWRYEVEPVPGTPKTGACS